VARISASAHRSARLLDLTLALVVAAVFALAPRLTDGLAALEWTRYYASRGAAPRRAVEQAERAGRAAARAIELGAPLPAASQAARLTLDLGRNLAPREPAAAAVLFGHVSRALARASEGRLTGLGLAGLAEEARGLEQAARARTGK
jgi:hypothetical protein